jgi:predicted nucleic acid-binding protein
VSTIFVDTSAFYALADAGESTHAVARATLTELERAGHDLLTTTDILDEIVTLVRYRLGHAAASALGEKLFASNWCRLGAVTDEIRSAAWEIFLKYDDQRFSLTDCTSFATMRVRHLSEAFTFDRADYIAAGFRTIPERTAARTRRRRRN